jgi:uncharacterized delta-60 repeat protein
MVVAMSIGRARFVLLVGLLLLAGGGLFLACGAALAPEVSPEGCDGGSCDEGTSPEQGSGSGVDGSVTSQDSSAAAADAAHSGDAGRDAADPTDAGGDAMPLVPLLPCEDGGLPGMLDPSFGDGGIVYIQPDPSTGSSADAVVIQPDGKTVLAGTVGGSDGSRFLMVRLTAGGGLDTSFGDGGIVDTPMAAGRNGLLDGVALAGDGHIVTVGHVLPKGGLSSDAESVLARYSAGGALDGTFGDAGLAFVTANPPEHAVLIGVTVLPDGRVLAVGSVGRTAAVSYDYLIVKLDPNGSLDTTFGTGGKVRVDIRSSDGVSALVLQPDGKILVAGSSATVTPTTPPTVGPRDLSAARLNPDGSLDPSFGSGGKVVHGLASEIQPRAIAVDGAGRIVLGARSPLFASDCATVRLTPTGALDATFGSGGVVITDLGGSDKLFGLRIQADGKYLGAGKTFTSGPFTTTRDALVRFLPDGTLDPSFGTSGKLVVPNPTGFNAVSSAATFSGSRATFVGSWARTVGGLPMPYAQAGVSRYCL